MQGVPTISPHSPSAQATQETILQLLQQRPHEARLYLALVLLYVSAGSWDAAATLLKSCLKMLPDWTEGSVMLGCAPPAITLLPACVLVQMSDTEYQLCVAARRPLKRGVGCSAGAPASLCRTHSLIRVPSGQLLHHQLLLRAGVPAPHSNARSVLHRLRPLRRAHAVQLWSERCCLWQWSLRCRCHPARCRQPLPFISRHRPLSSPSRHLLLRVRGCRRRYEARVVPPYPCP
jgi:hypothetical protein